jgi:hypothetical protein
MGGGSSVLVIAGLWLAIVGYAVLYTGVAKIGGDSSYHLGLALTGTAPTGAPAAAPAATGGANPGLGGNAGWQQAAMIGMVPLS